MTKRALVLPSVVVCFLTACSGQSTPASSSPTTSSAAAKLAANQNAYNFPGTVVGQVTTGPTFELSATGSGSLIVASVTSSNPAEFVLIGNACVGKTVVAGAPSSCQLSVNFQPITPGVRMAQLMIASSDGGSLALNVSGSAFASGSTGSGGTDGGGGGSGGNGGSASSGGSFPQALCVPNATGGIALSVINTTPVLIQVTFAGPTRVTASVPPGAIQTLAILPGNYTLTGEAPGAPNTGFLPSSWSTVNGCDYLLQIKASTTRPS